MSGRSEKFWPRPGGTFATARTHTFWDLAEAINTAFARWDRSHLSEFLLGDGTRISHAEPWMDSPEDTVRIREQKLSRLALDEQFACTFDVATVGPISGGIVCAPTCSRWVELADLFCCFEVLSRVGHLEAVWLCGAPQLRHSHNEKGAALRRPLVD